MEIMKKFISYYKPYKKVFFLDMLCALIISIVDLAFPQILNYLNNTFYVQPKEMIMDSLFILAIGLLIMYIVRALCRYYVTAQGHIMGAKMESDMRQDLFDQFERLSFSYYDQNNTGEMMSKLVSDLFDISELSHHGPENVFISLLKIFGSFILLLYIHVPLTLILIAVTVIMLVFSLFQNKKMQATFMDNRRKIAGVNASLQDSLAGIRVVKSFANEDIERDKFAHSNQMFLQSKSNNYYRMGLFHAGNNFFQGMLYLTILVAGGFFIAKGTLDPISLATYALYINIFVAPIEVLVEFTEMFQKGFSGFKRFLEVIETKPDIVDAENAKDIEEVSGVIDYEDVCFSYNEEETVLDHINFHIDAGKSIALVGPSGGGKTTICSLLPRFYDVNSGSIKVDGKDVRELTLESLRKAIGIVQQDVYLFTGSIKENIAYGRPGASDDEIIDAAKKANIHEFIMSLPDGYDTFVGERGTRLSGGQKQRISIARVFLKNPKILILDEATSALDNESERHIQKSLEELSKNRTCITIAHRLSTIRNADEIIVISENGMEERGSHEELMEKNGVYAKYYNLQFEGLDYDEQTKEVIHTK
ncbi:MULTISPECIES: ABC transporter ATP-binding protein [Bacillota]|uniref:ABC transporter ATP-binding protein n=2 Tax=Amedibacillus TaxID=2749846 RepID=A0A7G9GK11_9FIRM|nr:MULTISPECIES: ABC transporter ATP-binding protein [Bacillota]QNM11143.1 ABC transporter ATP-binding protein [[Eubacterium] hominis]MCH4284806.1 ABC transporter ATP-binding protein/permease [Amedibacillus hominis]RGB52637.1 ABC transporter ATP-binding protein [Absiella sp. AM22-9]RGB57110.1 ABC transporter ATP-binding protein [Absiella sp. AM10-20]RGB68039.1 ABC transporter ATP-binding protein [Absiella sp. AM09-45]